MSHTQEQINEFGNNLIIYSFIVQTRLKLFHWQTQSYHKHVESGKMYEKISDLIDKFVETYSATISPSKRIELKQGDKKTWNISIENITEQGLMVVLEHFKKNFLLSSVDSFLSKNHPELINIRDEMIQVINQFVYLMSMK